MADDLPMHFSSFFVLGKPDMRSTQTIPRVLALWRHGLDEALALAKVAKQNGSANVYLARLVNSQVDKVRVRRAAQELGVRLVAVSLKFAGTTDDDLELRAEVMRRVEQQDRAFRYAGSENPAVDQEAARAVQGEYEKMVPLLHDQRSEFLRDFYGRQSGTSIAYKPHRGRN